MFSYSWFVFKRTWIRFLHCIYSMSPLIYRFSLYHSKCLVFKFLFHLFYFLRQGLTEPRPVLNSQSSSLCFHTRNYRCVPPGWTKMLSICLLKKLNYFILWFIWSSFCQFHSFWVIFHVYLVLYFLKSRDLVTWSNSGLMFWHEDLPRIVLTGGT
jgi:hypothetical protein